MNNNEVNYDKLREMIARCEWTFAKTMPFAPHEYIVKEKCPLTTEEFEYFVNMQREHGVEEHWGKYNNPYLYIDDYKYWTMGAPLENTTVINRAKVNVLKDVQKINKEVERIKEEIEDSRPYFFNAVLNANPLEPGISSILAGFFKQKVDGRYQLLDSFIKQAYGCDFQSKVDKPIIKAEVEVLNQKRIDILVYEKEKYVIVFENKIWDAVEQPNQLTNYIEAMKEPEYGFDDKQIYVVYLPSVSGHGPTDESWNKGYQEKFKKRFRCLSFREDILKWLESDEVKSVNEDFFVHSRILFTDFLKRKFNLTETDNMENNKIDEYLYKELGLKEKNNGYNIALLESKIKEITDCLGHLERMKKSYYNRVVNEITESLEKDYPDMTISKELKFAQSVYTGIMLPFNGQQNAIQLLIGFEGQNYIYGATYAPEFKSLRSQMQEDEEISKFYSSGEFRKGSDWLFYKNTTVDEGYECLKDLINRMS